MALLPMTIKFTVDEEGGVNFQVEDDKRLNAWHLWTIAAALEHLAGDMHENDRFEQMQQAQMRQQLAASLSRPIR